MSDTKYTNLIKDVAGAVSDIRNLRQGQTDMKEDIGSQWSLLNGIAEKVTSICDANDRREKKEAIRKAEESKANNKRNVTITHWIGIVGVAITAIGVWASIFIKYVT